MQPSEDATGDATVRPVQFVADGVFYAELNELLTRELAEHGYSGVEVRVTPMRTEIIIKATRTQNVLGGLRYTAHPARPHPLFWQARPVVPLPMHGSRAVQADPSFGLISTTDDWQVYLLRRGWLHNCSLMVNRPPPCR